MNQKGERNNRAVLTWKIIYQIREDYKNGYMVPDIAAKYHISRSHANNIVNNKRWI